MAASPTGDHERLHRLVYRLAAGFLFAAAMLRSVLIYDGRDLLVVLAALAAWLLLLVAMGWLGGTGELPGTRPHSAPGVGDRDARVRRAVGRAGDPGGSRSPVGRAGDPGGSRSPGGAGRAAAPDDLSAHRRAPWFAACLAIQCGLIALLLYAGGDSGDFFAILFAVLGMQVVARYRLRVALVVLGLFVPVMFVPLAMSYDPAQALVFTLIYSAATALVAAYTVASRRAVETTAANEGLAAELRAANRGLEAYSTQLGRLAAARERHRLAHDLHDSVTQTIFSMTLTTQSAALLLDRDPPRVAAQLDRLAQLTRGALAEMQLLISELTPDRRLEGGLVANLERHLAERAAPHGVEVAVEVTGDGVLSAQVEQNLLRIAQEAVSNIVKHADADAATVRLTLVPPYRLQIEDQGRGFDADAARAAEAGGASAAGGGRRGPSGDPGHGSDGSAAGRPARRPGSGLGLASMRERAAEIGWAFAVRSRPGGGTLVTVEEQPGADLQAAAATPPEITTGRHAAGGARADAEVGAGSGEAGKGAGRDG